MSRRRAATLSLALVVAVTGVTPASGAANDVPPVAFVAPAASGPDWQWPVIGPVTNAFDPPQTPFGAGHRGIDIATAVGTEVVAPEAATVAFAGKVGGHLFVTLDHGGGLESTYSWVSSILVRKGDTVARGAPIARSGPGHPGSSVPHLHLGVKQDDVYVDPLEFLGPASLSSFIRLAPLGPG